MGVFVKYLLVVFECLAKKDKLILLNNFVSYPQTHVSKRARMHVRTRILYIFIFLYICSF